MFNIVGVDYSRCSKFW